jgi:hypothetical protein
MSGTIGQPVSDPHCGVSRADRAAGKSGVVAGILSCFLALPCVGPFGPVISAGPAHAEPSEADAQRAIITVRDASGVKGAPIPLSIQVDGPSAEGAKLNVHIGDVPKGAVLTDGSHIATAEKDRDLVDVTGWNLSKATFSLPPDATGQFTMALVAVVENAVRPLLTQASFVVTVGADPTPLTTGSVRTVQADVNPDQIAVRTRQDPDPAHMAAAADKSSERGDQQAWTDPGPQGAPAQAPLGPPRPAPRDPVAEALASDRKSWLERERTRTKTLTRELTAAHEQIGELKSKVNSPPERVRGTAEQTEERAAALKEAGVARLLSKAEELIRRGDVSGARLLLERALETGSHEAAFYLAQTFDPRFLHSWNVQGISPDPEKARALYTRAHEAGLTRAKALADAVH